MKLKEIKPSMIIHCKNDDEKRMLYDELCRMGVMDTGDPLDSWENFNNPNNNLNYEIYMQKKLTWGFSLSPSSVSFSDLIIPEPEVEWFWQGRIFKILEDGGYYQIKDGTGFYDTGCEYRESAEEFMADELKEYCKTHDGDYIATVEHVCRIKSN